MAQSSQLRWGPVLLPIGLFCPPGVLFLGTSNLWPRVVSGRGTQAGVEQQHPSDRLWGLQPHRTGCCPPPSPDGGDRRLAVEVLAIPVGRVDVKEE